MSSKRFGLPSLSDSLYFQRKCRITRIIHRGVSTIITWGDMSPFQKSFRNEKVVSDNPNKASAHLPASQRIIQDYLVNVTSAN